MNNLGDGTAYRPEDDFECIPVCQLCGEECNDTCTSECSVCEGSGGWDVARDCEEDDEWITCPECSGRGGVTNER